MHLTSPKCLSFYAELSFLNKFTHNGKPQLKHKLLCQMNTDLEINPIY